MGMHYLGGGDGNARCVAVVHYVSCITDEMHAALGQHRQQLLHAAELLC